MKKFVPFIILVLLCMSAIEAQTNLKERTVSVSGTAPLEKTIIDYRIKATLSMDQVYYADTRMENLEQLKKQYFNALKEQGIDKSLNEYFDLLVKGVGAAAFHPMIRLSYAVRDRNDDEVAISLGTWAASFLNLNVSHEISNEVGILEILKNLKIKNFNQNKKIEADNIANRMLKVSESEDYKKLSSVILWKDLKKEELERSLLWLFSQTNNFTLLHGVTSHHAFESLLRFSSEKDIARAFYWKAILAAYLSTTGVVNIDLSWKLPEIENLLPWNDLKKKAVESNDDHVIKLVHILSVKDKERLDYELRYASSLKLGILNDS